MNIEVHLIPVLQNTPGVLEALLTGLPESWIVANEGDGTWSPFDVVGHLIHGEKTDWIERARIILDGGGAFRPFDRFAQFDASRGKSVQDLLKEFRSLRMSNIAQIIELNIQETQLAMQGIHPAFGTVTLDQLLSTWIAHDLGHIAQISRVLAKVQRGNVGPWLEYLPILGA